MAVVDDDYPGVTDFGADPSHVSAETIRKIEREVKNLQFFMTPDFVAMGDHPTMGKVLIVKNDRTGGVVFKDGVTLI